MVTSASQASQGTRGLMVGLIRPARAVSVVVVPLRTFVSVCLLQRDWADVQAAHVRRLHAYRFVRSR
jgi:hypothetical protein